MHAVRSRTFFVSCIFFFKFFFSNRVGLEEVPKRARGLPRPPPIHEGTLCFQSLLNYTE